MAIVPLIWKNPLKINDRFVKIHILALHPWLMKLHEQKNSAVVIKSLNGFISRTSWMHRKLLASKIKLDISLKPKIWWPNSSVELSLSYERSIIISICTCMAKLVNKRRFLSLSKSCVIQWKVCLGFSTH